MITSLSLSLSLSPSHTKKPFFFFFSTRRHLPSRSFCALSSLSPSVSRPRRAADGNELESTIPRRKAAPSVLKTRERGEGGNSWEGTGGNDEKGPRERKKRVRSFFPFRQRAAAALQRKELSRRPRPQRRPMSPRS